MRMLFAFLLTVLVTPAFAAEGTGITIDKASTIETPAAFPTTNVFMAITNNGKADDVLVGASTPLTKQVEIMSTVMDAKGIAAKKLETITIPAGKTVMLAPLGDSILLTNTNTQMGVGKTFPLTLTFAKAGKKEVTVQAVSPQEFSKRFTPASLSDSVKKLDAAKAPAAPASGQTFVDNLMKLGAKTETSAATDVAVDAAKEAAGVTELKAPAGAEEAAKKAPEKIMNTPAPTPTSTTAQ